MRRNEFHASAQWLRITAGHQSRVLDTISSQFLGDFSLFFLLKGTDTSGGKGAGCVHRLFSAFLLR